MSIEAVLFDVGGPIDTEVMSEALIDADIRSELAAEGVSVSNHTFAAAERWAVESFAPNLYQAIIWRLSRHNQVRARRVWRRVERHGEARDRQRGGIELRPDVAALLGELSSAGLRLGLAANQPARAVAALDRLGIGKWFDYRGVSGTNGLRKPDPRVFLAACEGLGVSPTDCVMIGDRIDLDIVPSRQLGMFAVRIRTGRHASQQPRSWTEVPHIEVSDLRDLAASILLLNEPRARSI